MIRKRPENEEASAGVIAVYILGLIVFLVVWIMFNPEMDFLSQFGATGVVNMSTTTIQSASATDTVYKILPIIFLIFWTICAYVTSLRARTQG